LDEKKREESYEKEKIKKQEGESEKNDIKEDSRLRRAKVERIKKLIERGEYNISPEEIAEKMLEFFKKHRH